MEYIREKVHLNIAISRRRICQDNFPRHALLRYSERHNGKLHNTPLENFRPYRAPDSRTMFEQKETKKIGKRYQVSHQSARTFLRAGILAAENARPAPSRCRYSLL